MQRVVYSDIPVTETELMLKLKVFNILNTNTT